jgi:DNA repair protein RecO (recombination protein O)
VKSAGRPSGRRVWLAPAYVLHQYPYRDTSRIVEVFTSEHGRLTLFARGANGPKSSLKGVLRPFQRLLVSWSGRTEACQLLTAEIDGSLTSMGKERLMSGFYLNELLLKLTERCDPHPEIFYSYASCVEALSAGEGEEPSLRRFEKRLLDDLGYGLELSRTEEGQPVEPDRYYRFATERGPQPCVAEAPGAVYGRSLADLSAETFADARSLRDAKRVLRVALDACLDGRSLKSREVMLAMRRREPLLPREQP